MSDKKRLCKWGLHEIPIPSNEAVICTLSVFPETKSVVLTSNQLDPNTNFKLPILSKDDPPIVPDPTTKEKRGYSSMKLMYIQIILTCCNEPKIQRHRFINFSFN